VYLLCNYSIARTAAADKYDALFLSPIVVEESVGTPSGNRRSDRLRKKMADYVGHGKDESLLPQKKNLGIDKVSLLL
jgi:hypothetical protein